MKAAKETGLKALGKSTSYLKNSSSNPVSEFVAISLDDKKIAEEILQFMRSFGFLFNGRHVTSFTANEFCYLSKRMRLLIEIIENLRLLDRKKPASFFSLLQLCVEIQTSCKPWCNYSWIDSEEIYDSPQSFEQARKRSTRQHYYSFSNNNFSVEHVKWLEKFPETNSALLRAKEMASFQNDLEDIEHDCFEAETLDLLLSTFEQAPFYFSDGKITLKDKSQLDQPLPKAKELTEKLSLLAEMIIEQEINCVVPEISYAFTAQDQVASPQSLNLFEMMYFSLMVLDHRNYVYTDCANPRCRKKVLRSITGANGGYCCYACRKRHNAAELRAAKAQRKGGAATL